MSSSLSKILSNMMKPKLKAFRNSVGPLLVLALMFCGAYIHQVTAQTSEVLSPKPLVYKAFDRDKNESTVTTILFDLSSLVFDPNRTVPDLRLNNAEYTYSGTLPSRPSTVSFVFLPRDKYKTAPNFSVTVDGTSVQEGDTTLREMCCVQINGRNANPQHIVVSVPLETFERITQAQKTEIKLVSNRGKYSFKLNDSQKKSLTALKNTIK